MTKQIEERDGWIKGEGQELEPGQYWVATDNMVAGKYAWAPWVALVRDYVPDSDYWYKLRELAPKRPEQRIEDKLVEGRWYLVGTWDQVYFWPGRWENKLFYVPMFNNRYSLEGLDEIWTINEGEKGERLK